MGIVGNWVGLWSAMDFDCCPLTVLIVARAQLSPGSTGCVEFRKVGG